MPIYIGASGPAATRLAGRIADGFITTSGKAPTLYSDTLLPALAEGAGKAGRTLDDLDLLIEMKVSFDPDRAKALADTKYWGALALTPEQKSGVEDPIEMQRLADALPGGAGGVAVDRLHRSRMSTSRRSRPTTTWASGTSSSTPPAPIRRGSSRLYGEQVLPRLRALELG